MLHPEGCVRYKGILKETARAEAPGHVQKTRGHAVGSRHESLVSNDMVVYVCTKHWG